MYIALYHSLFPVRLLIPISLICFCVASILDMGALIVIDRANGVSEEAWPASISNCLFSIQTAANQMIVRFISFIVSLKHIPIHSVHDEHNSKFFRKYFRAFFWSRICSSDLASSSFPSWTSLPSLLSVLSRHLHCTHGVFRCESLLD